MSSIKELFKSSWETFKASLLNLFLVTLVNVFAQGLFLAVAVAVIVLALVTGGLTVDSLADDLTKVFSGLGILAVISVVGIVYLLATIVVSAIFTAAVILAVGRAEEKIDLGQVLRGSLERMWPVILANLVLGFLIIGSLVPFVFPVFIVSILLFPVLYEVVLERRGVLESIRFSVGMVKLHFGEIIVRLLVFFGLSILVAIVIYFPQVVMSFGAGVLGPKEGIGLNIFSSMWGFAMVIPNTLFGWFGLVYLFNLYKQARAVTPAETKAKSWWLWAIAVFGWIVLMLTVALIIAGVWISQKEMRGNLTKLNQDVKEVKQLQKELDEYYKVGVKEETRVYIDSSLRKLEEVSSFAKAKGLTNSQRDQIVSLANLAIMDAKRAQEIEPENAAVWANLGYVYSVVSFIEGANEWAIDSYKKAIALDPANYLYHEKLGEIYYRLENYEAAVKEYQTVTKLYTNYPNGFFNLGVALKAYGLKPAAKEAFQKCLGLMSPDSPGRDKVERELESL